MTGNENHDKLVMELCDAWESLDADKVEPLLTDDLHFSSWWLLKETNTKEEYMDYLRGRFQSNGLIYLIY